MLKPMGLKGMYFQPVETRALSTRGQADVNLAPPYRERLAAEVSEEDEVRRRHELLAAHL